VQINKHQIPSTKFQIPNTKFQVRSTKWEVRSGKYEVQIKILSADFLPEFNELTNLSAEGTIPN